MSNVIDLFAGCGGLSLGFMKDGYTITKAVEFDPMIANTYKMNHKDVDVIVDDIRNVDHSGIFKTNEAEIIIGGPPCQGFSTAGARIRHGFVDDPRNYLFKHYFNIVNTVRPDYFVFENVKGITTMKKGEIFNEILKIFADKEILGTDTYCVYYKLVKAVEFGVPQKRERMIIIGVKGREINFDNIWEKTKNDISLEHPHFFDKVTVKDAIGNLPNVTEDGCLENPKPVTNYQKYLSTESKVLTNHNKTKHNEVAIRRMKQVKCGENFHVLNEEIKSVHSGSYGRLEWDKPAQTITTRFDTPAGGRFTHPVEDRTITPREAARLQSFPDDIVFYGNRTSICKQIGNAVPPKVSYFLAKLIDNIKKES